MFFEGYFQKWCLGTFINFNVSVFGNYNSGILGHFLSFFYPFNRRFELCIQDFGLKIFHICLVHLAHEIWEFRGVVLRLVLSQIFLKIVFRVLLLNLSFLRKFMNSVIFTLRNPRFTSVNFIIGHFTITLIRKFNFRRTRLNSGRAPLRDLRVGPLGQLGLDATGP